MSFSSQTKDELARVFPERPCCKLAELAALVRMDGTITINPKHKVGLYVNTENAGIARKIFSLGKALFNFEVEIRVHKRTRLKKGNLYSVHFLPHPQMAAFLKAMGILDKNGTIRPRIKKSLIRTQCCRRSYLRGAFLGAGSVNNPEGNYHLEIITSSEEYACSLADLINRFPGMQAKVSGRKNLYFVYLKRVSRSYRCSVSSGHIRLCWISRTSELSRECATRSTGWSTAKRPTLTRP